MTTQSTQFASLLRHFARLIERRETGELEKLLDTLEDVGLSKTRDSSTERKPKSSKSEVGPSKSREIIELLQSAPDRESGASLLRGLSLTKRELTDLARNRSVHVTKEDNLRRIEEKLIEAIIGSKLNSQAIRGNSKTDLIQEERDRKSERQSIESEPLSTATTHYKEALGQTADAQKITVRSTSNDFEHSALIKDSKLVRIIMNDGFRFFRKYRDSFETRVNDASKRTEICLMAPHGPQLEIVALRSEKDIEEQRNDVLNSRDLIKHIFQRSQRPSENSLYFMRNFFPYCLFQYDDLIITSVYFAFQREEELPMYVYEKTGNPSHVYYQLLKNADKLFRNAELGDTRWFVSGI